jgi:hypothetical protein
MDSVNLKLFRLLLSVKKKAERVYGFTQRLVATLEPELCPRSRKP